VNQHQQILQNLTTLAGNPYALPRHVTLHDGTAQITDNGSFEHVRSGRDEPCGVGSVRIFRTWPLKIVEEVVDLVPERRVSYIVHRGLPFRDYRADIELTAGADGGTTIR
jgi:hypothetical protein